jgi:hypothetical protein
VACGVHQLNQGDITAEGQKEIVQVRMNQANCVQYSNFENKPLRVPKTDFIDKNVNQSIIHRPVEHTLNWHLCLLTILVIKIVL